MWGKTYEEPSLLAQIFVPLLGFIIAVSIFLLIFWIRLKFIIWIISKIVIGVRENVNEHDKKMDEKLIKDN